MTPERELLREIDEYLAELQDVTDGSYGEPHPNRAMSLIGQIDALLALPATQRSEPEIPLCGGCAQAWFTERNLLRGDHSCVVCAFLGNAAPLSETPAIPSNEAQILAAKIVVKKGEFADMFTASTAGLLLATEILRIAHPNGIPSTAPSGTAKVPEGWDGEHCQACGRGYDDVYSVPDAVWERISPKQVDGFKGGGLLCPTCALERVCRLLAAAPSPEGKE